MRTAMLLGVGALPSSSGAETRRGAAVPAQFRSAAAPAARLRMARSVRSAGSVTVEAVTTIEKKGADIWNKSYYPKGEDMVATEKAWVVIDAKGQRLGRMATLIAGYLRGANTPSYHPSCDTGAFVVVINAELVEVTGKKAEQKTYHRSFNGRPGSHKARHLWWPCHHAFPQHSCYNNIYLWKNNKITFLTPCFFIRWRPSSTCKRVCRSASSRRQFGAPHVFPRLCAFVLFVCGPQNPPELRPWRGRRRDVPCSTLEPVI